MLQPKDTDWLNRYKHRTHIYAVYKRPTSDLDTHILSQSERMEKIFHANGNQKEVGVAILISHKIDFKTKTVIRDKVGHHIMTKGSIQEEDITIVNILCTQHRSTSIHKANANSHNRRTQQEHNNIGRL